MRIRVEFDLPDDVDSTSAIMSIEDALPEEAEDFSWDEVDS
jgi:hypothetical protein